MMVILRTETEVYFNNKIIALEERIKQLEKGILVEVPIDIDKQVEKAVKKIFDDLQDYMKKCEEKIRELERSILAEATKGKLEQEIDTEDKTLGQKITELGDEMIAESKKLEDQEEENSRVSII